MVSFLRTNLTFFYLKRASNSFRFFSSTTVFDTLRNTYDFPPELASRVASNLKSAKNADSVLSFFKSSGFSSVQLQKTLKYDPQILCSNIDHTIKPKIEFFHDQGFSSADISKVISTNPRILRSSLDNNIIPSLTVMKGFLGSNDAVARVVRSHPMFVCWNMKTTVVANVEFLKSCGVPMDRIKLAFRTSPTSFQMKPEVIRRAADKANEMGINAASNAFVYAVSTIVSMSSKSWELKLQGFRDAGFSDSDISTMFRKVPLVLRVSTAKMKKIQEVLLATGKFSISSIVNYPASLTYSLKRYEVRLGMLKSLESRKLIKHWPSLSQISQISDDEFFEKFIRPYSAGDAHFIHTSAGFQKGVEALTIFQNTTYIEPSLLGFEIFNIIMSMQCRGF